MLCSGFCYEDRAAFAILLIPFSAPAASLTGAVVDQTGAYIPHAAVELDSGTKKYQGPSRRRRCLPILESAGRRIYADDSACRDSAAARSSPSSSWKANRNECPTLRWTSDMLRVMAPLAISVLLPPGTLSGRLSGSVDPPARDVEVTLVCRTFSACRSTKTDSNGHFSFEMLSAGVYGLNFRRDGFYPENATGYEYTVNAGWESVYSPVVAGAVSQRQLRP